MKQQQQTKYVDIFGLQDLTGIPVRTIRSLYGARKISVIKLGHRTLLFDPALVKKELESFEIPSAKP